jgi:eukaryotic-like serine/threonine-protein kinase
MSWPQLIAPPLSTPHEESARRSARRDLPPDLLRDVSRRFAVLSLVGASLWLTGTLSGHIASWAMAPSDPSWRQLGPVDAITAVSVLVSLFLFWYVRGPRRDPKKIRNFGLFYMVFTSGALALMIHVEPPPANVPVFPLISWAGAVVLMSPAIVPSTPLPTLIASLIAVSMNPLAMLLARARGIWNFSSASDAFLMHYPDYMLAGVAVVISHVVTRLGQQVAKAREMGSYQLGDLIGRGGMGEVYRATHRMLARPAAIKLIRPDMLGSDRVVAQRLMSRFRREAETAASLRSAHTVELYDFGMTDDETLYIVMELLEGLELESIVRRYGPMPAGRVVYLLRQVCESLEEAHARGLVHRDIKPANIHVGPHGLHYDFVKVLDFGLAKSVDAVDVDQTLASVSIEGHIVGTPAFMAPEVALGETIDARADLYAVGCVAYYMLTGQQVFEADKMLQLITKHLEAEPKPPSLATELPVPPALDRIVLACLAKKADQRPASAADLSRLLAAVETDTWDEDQAMEWWRIHQPSSVVVAPHVPQPATR